MKGWKKSRIDEVCEIVSGATPSTSDDSCWNGDICWVTPKDLSELDGAYIHDTPRKLTRAGLESCSANLLPPNSVLFSSRAPIGHTAINTVQMATNQGFKSFIPAEGVIDPKYLFHWLRKNRSYLESLGNGATFKEVSKAVIARVELSFPALPEQRRIAAILDQAEALRTRRRAALAKLDTLAQSIFIEMFGDPAFNPKSWPIRTIGELASKYSDGPFGSNLKSEHYTEHGVRVIRLQNIGIGELSDDDLAFISEDHFALLRKHECLPGDLLIGTLGDPNLRACIQPESLPVALNKADCVQLRPNSKVAEAEYLCALLNHPSTGEMAGSLVLGQTRGRISMGRLRGFEVPVPPLELQTEFSRRLKFFRQWKSLYIKSLTQFGDLFTSLQHRAFRGEL